MTTEMLLPPRPDALLQSMRDIGYSVETAVADLIDNSISAGASNIRIFWDATVPCLTVLDDGKGMGGEELIAAMQHGSTHPEEYRDKHDLGRFGLGLKTASLSQCRRLTVVSSQHGIRHAAEWDLDLVERKNEWALLSLDDDDIARLPHIDRLQGDGTMVIWRELDRFCEGEKGQLQENVIADKIHDVDRHLSLVFHRFLSGGVARRKKISIFINEHPVAAFDPFLRDNSVTRELPEETLRFDGKRIRMQPYILPHYSRLSSKEYNYYYRDRRDLFDQGLYIYRAGRLMVWGDWLRLIPKGEGSRLARIQIDFPNSIDKYWSIDIKKSRAQLPRQVRDRLKQLIDRISGESMGVIRGRGATRLSPNTPVPIWDRYADRGRIRYCISREHPLVLYLMENIDEEMLKGLDILLKSVEFSLPIEMIYTDYSADPKKMDRPPPDEDLLHKLVQLRKILVEDQQMSMDKFREIVLSLGQYVDHVDTVDRWIREKLS